MNWHHCNHLRSLAGPKSVLPDVGSQCLLITTTIFNGNIISPLLYGCLLSFVLEMWIFICPRHNEFLGSVVCTELMFVFSAISKTIPLCVSKALQLLWCIIFERNDV